jgi:hypothetical protein
MLGLRMAGVRQLLIAEGKGGHHRVIPAADRFLREVGDYLPDKYPETAPRTGYSWCSRDRAGGWR